MQVSQIRTPSGLNGAALCGSSQPANPGLGASTSLPSASVRFYLIWDESGAPVHSVFSDLSEAREWEARLIHSGFEGVCVHRVVFRGGKWRGLGLA